MSESNALVSPEGLEAAAKAWIGQKCWDLLDDDERVGICESARKALEAAGIRVAETVGTLSIELCGDGTPIAMLIGNDGKTLGTARTGDTIAKLEGE